MPDVSIAISAKDNFTDALRKMQQKITPFRKDIEALDRELTDLKKNKVDLQVDLTKAKKRLDEAKREFKKLGDAAHESELATAQADYDQIRSNLNLVSKAAQQAERDMQKLSGTTAKTETQLVDTTAKIEPQLDDGIESGSLLSRIAQAGATQMIGQAVSEIAQSYVSSAYGSNAGTLFSSGLSGAASGAAIGSMVAPGVGTAVGAAAGGLIGLVQGGTQVYEERDSAFRAYVQQATEDALAAQNTMLTSGSTLAAQREIDRLSFKTLFGDKQVARSFLSELQAMANYTPFEYDDLTAMSKTLKVYGYDRSHILPTLSIIGDAGSALGMGADDMNWVATSIGRMNATGKTTLEYINPLQERGIDAIGALSSYYEVSQGDIYDMISKGEIAGQEAARVILQAMTDAFSGSMREQSQTMTGLQSTLEDANAELEAAAGEEYNRIRKEGLQKQIDFLSGETGQQMKDTYSAIGAWKAELENSREEIERDIMSAVMNGTALTFDYGESKAEIERSVAEMQAQYAALIAEGAAKDGAEAGQVLVRAQALAASAYNASEGAQIALESELELAGKIRDDTASNDAFWDAGFRKSEYFSKGLAAGMAQIDVSGIVSSSISARVQSSGRTATASTGNVYADTVRSAISRRARGHAYGLNRVPYDEFPALLHEGERVLTASQARQQDAGAAGGQIVITGNTFTVREEADIGRIARELARQLTIQRAVSMP